MKILVCDDHALFREGVVHALREMGGDTELLEAGDAVDALRLAQVHADLDLVLLDLNMPGGDGWSGLARLQQACPTLPVVILSASEDPRDARRAIDAGAAGFVTKSTRGPVLRAALALVLSVGIRAAPRAGAGGGGGRARARAPRSDATSRLTERQLEVLRLLARGLTNAEIGEVLASRRHREDPHRRHLRGARRQQPHRSRAGDAAPGSRPGRISCALACSPLSQRVAERGAQARRGDRLGQVHEAGGAHALEHVRIGLAGDDHAATCAAQALRIAAIASTPVAPDSSV